MVNHLLRSDKEFQIGYEENTEQDTRKLIHADIFFKTMKDKAEKMEGEYFNTSSWKKPVNPLVNWWR